MPCIITDIAMDLAADNTAVPLAGITVIARPATQPVFVSVPPFREINNPVRFVVTGTNGQWSFSLPWPSEQDTSRPWQIVTPDQAVWQGSIPEGVAGPLTLNDLRQTYGWGLVSAGGQHAVPIAVAGPTGPQGSAGVGTNAYVVQAGAPSAGTFPTIAAAVAAAVADGVSRTNPRTIRIEGGSYTEIVTLADGITLYGYGAVLLDSQVNIPDGALCNLVGLRFRHTAAATTTMIVVNSDAVVQGCILNAYDCQFDDTGFHNQFLCLVNGVANALGGVANFYNCNATMNNANTSGLFQASAGQVLLFGGIYISALGTVINVPSGIAYAQGTQLFSFTADTIHVGAGRLTLLWCQVYQLDGAFAGVRFLGASLGLIFGTLFGVVDGGSNKAVRGQSTQAQLWWGGNMFFPPGNGYTNKFDSTTMVNSVHCVVDDITAT